MNNLNESSYGFVCSLSMSDHKNLKEVPESSLKPFSRKNIINMLPYIIMYLKADTMPQVEMYSNPLEGFILLSRLLIIKKAKKN